MYSRSTVCDASGATLDQLIGWTNSRAGIPILSNDERRDWQFETIMLTALVKRLTDIGINVSRAANAALVFTHTGVDSFDASGTAPSRMPGQLYTEGRTLLILRPGQAYGDVVNVQDAQPWFSAWSDLASGADGVVVIDVGPIHREVSAKLKLAK